MRTQTSKTLGLFLGFSGLMAVVACQPATEAPTAEAPTTEAPAASTSTTEAAPSANMVAGAWSGVSEPLSAVFKGEGVELSITCDAAAKNYIVAVDKADGVTAGSIEFSGGMMTGPNYVGPATRRFEGATTATATGGASFAVAIDDESQSAVMMGTQVKATFGDRVIEAAPDTDGVLMQLQTDCAQIMGG